MVALARYAFCAAVLLLMPTSIPAQSTTTNSPATGAIRGRVTINGQPGQIGVAEGAKLSARRRVYVIPAERECADDVWRYAQVNANGEGSFTLTNLAPGKYWLLA